MESRALLMACFKKHDGETSVLSIVNDIKKSFLNIVESTKTDSVKFIELVGLSVSEYNYGKHRSAYNLFEDAMSYIPIESLIKPLMDKHLFRLRNKITSDPNEMFHIPLEQRYKVGTQRYSFPGLPCLYMGNSVDVCKEETLIVNGTKDHNYSIARYTVNSSNSPKVLDLSYYFDLTFEEMSVPDQQNFINILPLIALCSIRCNYPSGENIRFKSEYIIPQMLLEYIMNLKQIKTGEILGVKYRSVYHMHDIWIDANTNNKWNNYVFPAISNQPSGFSKLLQEVFLFEEFV